MTEDPEYGVRDDHVRPLLTSSMTVSNEDVTKYGSVVIKVGGNDNVVVTFTVVLIFTFITKSQ